MTLVTGTVFTASMALAGVDMSAVSKQCGTRKAQPKKQIVTGSHIPRQVTGDDSETTGASPVDVITRQDIARSGSNSVTGVLRNYPGITIRRR